MILVAGIGNIFLGDDGFGVEVARRFLDSDLPEGVKVADYGIRGLHLAYELVEQDYDLTVLVDATSRGGEPGTLYLIEPELHEVPVVAPTNGHGVHPEAVFSVLRSLGGTPGRVLILGVEPQSVEHGMSLSPSVAKAVPGALRMVKDILDREPAER